MSSLPCSCEAKEWGGGPYRKETGQLVHGELQGRRGHAAEGRGARPPRGLACARQPSPAPAIGHATSGRGWAWPSVLIAEAHAGCKRRR